MFIIGGGKAGDNVPFGLTKSETVALILQKLAEFHYAVCDDTQFK